MAPEGGEGGIRTHGPCKGTRLFESRALGQTMRPLRVQKGVYSSLFEKTAFQQKTALWGRFFAFQVQNTWHRPTLAGVSLPTTIGAEGLNCCVRNGNRCFPLAKGTKNSALEYYFDNIIAKTCD